MITDNINLKDYKYRIELHAHTKPASACSEISPEDVVSVYHSLNCHAVCITNHFTSNLFPGTLSKTEHEETVIKFYNDFLRAKTQGDKLGIEVIFGLELRFAENINDYLIYGIDFDEALKISYLLGTTVADFRNNYKNENSVFIQAHPFRNGMTEVPISLLDGIEAFNMHPHHNSRIGVSAKYALQNNLIAIAGTDYHHPSHEGLAITQTKTLPKNSFELAAILKTSDFIINIGGFIVHKP